MAQVVIEHKKGEVNELKATLRNPAVDRDPEKKREVVKRVIAYMTLGIDVSKLFSEMIMATGTKDHVIKKMVYLYITTYAASNPELSLLAINTLQKDCRDEDPMTRGLALRSFTPGSRRRRRVGRQRQQRGRIPRWTVKSSLDCSVSPLKVCSSVRCSGSSPENS